MITQIDNFAILCNFQSLKAFSWLLTFLKVIFMLTQLIYSDCYTHLTQNDMGLWGMGIQVLYLDWVDLSSIFSC